MMAIILRYFNEFGTLRLITSQWLKLDTHFCNKIWAQKSHFRQSVIYSDFSEITESEKESIVYVYLKRGTPHSTAEVRIVQDCAAM